MSSLFALCCLYFLHTPHAANGYFTMCMIIPLHVLMSNIYFKPYQSGKISNQFWAMREAKYMYCLPNLQFNQIEAASMSQFHGGNLICLRVSLTFIWNTLRQQQWDTIKVAVQIFQAHFIFRKNQSCAVWNIPGKPGHWDHANKFDLLIKWNDFML
jgi:hypothetical protein